MIDTHCWYFVSLLYLYINVSEAILEFEKTRNKSCYLIIFVSIPILIDSRVFTIEYDVLENEMDIY